ncbi:hypothetical protein B7760_05357 [Burkholderia glumae]|nr:hypothetical protein B7760_05357 [Burkholderia glumae]
MQFFCQFCIRQTPIHLQSPNNLNIDFIKFFHPKNSLKNSNYNLCAVSCGEGYGGRRQ